MPVHASMAFAFLGAERTSLRARLQRGDDHLLVASGPASSDAARSYADVGAVEVQPDALPKVSNHLLGQACVSARGAALGAAVALLDAANERIIRVAADVGVSGNHLSHVVHGHGSIGRWWIPLTNPTLEGAISLGD